MTVYERVDNFFESWGRLIYRRRWLALALSLMATIAFGAALPKLTVDSSVEGILLKDDAVLERYRSFQQEFGQDNVILLTVATPNVFDLQFLEKLRNLQSELQRDVPNMAQITSLLNVRNTRGEGDTLIVEDLFEKWPEDEAALAVLRERVVGNPLYVNYLVNGAGTLAAIVLEASVYSSLDTEDDQLAGFEDDASDAGSLLLSDTEVAAQLQAIERTTAQYDSPDFKIRISGSAPVDAHFDQIVTQDAGRAVLIALAINALILALLFRRVSGVALPVLIIVATVLSTFGSMAILGTPMSITLSIMPRFLIVATVTSVIHLLAAAYHQLSISGNREEAVAYALRHSGFAVLLSCLTTAGGLISFVSAELTHVINLGVISAVGTLLVFSYTVVMLPALLSIVPLRRKETFGGKRTQAVLMGFLLAIGRLATTRPKLVLGSSLAVIAFCAVGIGRITVSEDSLKWFPEGDTVRESTEFLNRELGGSLNLEVLIRTGRENGLRDADTMSRLERAHDFAESAEYGDLKVGKALSLVQVVKETHQALNGNDPAFYRIPDDSALISQELLLFESSGPSELEPFVNSSFSTARLTLRQQYADAMNYGPFAEKIRDGVQEIMGEGSQVEVTGLVTLIGTSFSYINESMIRSFILAFLIILPQMVLMIGSLRLGLLSMLPNLAPIIMTLGVMGWLDIPLNTTTLLIGAIILGLAVDDTIHFMYGFRRYFAEDPDVSRAVRKTIESTGTAIFATTTVLTLGFFGAVTAYLTNVAQSGLLLAFAVTVAFIADLFMTPALLKLFAGKGGSSSELALRSSQEEPARISGAA